MVRPGVWLVVGEMRREIAIISTDQATTASSRNSSSSSSKPPWHAPSENAPSKKGTPKHSRSRIAQRNVPSLRSLRPLSLTCKHKKKAPRSDSLPCSCPWRASAAAVAAASLSYMYIAWTNIVRVSSRQSIACLRESRRDARELLLSTWDGDMSCPLPPSITG